MEFGSEGGRLSLGEVMSVLLAGLLSGRTSPEAASVMVVCSIASQAGERLQLNWGSSNLRVRGIQGLVKRSDGRRVISDLVAPHKQPSST